MAAVMVTSSTPRSAAGQVDGGVHTDATVKGE
jgi:hypothetical protein